MKVSTIQSLDYLLKRLQSSNKVSSNVKILVSLNGNLFYGDFIKYLDGSLITETLSYTGVQNDFLILGKSNKLQGIETSNQKLDKCDKLFDAPKGSVPLDTLYKVLKYFVSSSIDEENQLDKLMFNAVSLSNPKLVIPSIDLEEFETLNVLGFIEPLEN